MGNKPSTADSKYKEASASGAVAGGSPAGGGAAASGGESPRSPDATPKTKRTSRMRKSLETFISGAPVTDDVNKKYILDKKVMGHGHYGIVRRCQDRANKEHFAIKTIKKSRVSRPEVLVREIEILNRVRHPNIIEVVDVYHTDEDVHIITELCTGGAPPLCIFV
jgi:serine/threonine protein kinase